MISTASLLLCLFIISLQTSAFDINDPKTNIDSLVRVIGSTDPNDVDILYGNGTIYGRKLGEQLKKLFFFEGFNIGRKVNTGHGYLSLTREVFVYRDLHTGEIIDIWSNVYSGESNEIYQVHNDPIDMNFTYGTTIVPTALYPESGVGFISDIRLQYPNLLDPQHYGNFSAGPLYQADELFQYFSDYDKLSQTKISSLNMTGAWFRRAQYLPWMQMGTRGGHLYYMSANWKCLKGFDDFSPDLLQLVKTRFPEFMTPPSTYNPVPQTTWGVIKENIDRRRAHGLPDVILPMIKVTPNATVKTNSLDPRVKQTFLTEEVRVFFNGSVYSEITGKDSVELFKVTGTMVTKSKLILNGETIINMLLQGQYLDPKTEQVMTTFKNPFTKKSISVPDLLVDKDFKFLSEHVFSIEVPHLDKVCMQGVTSDTAFVNGREKWSVDMMTIFFKNSDLEGRLPFFYGTWAHFGSWYDWMDMGNIDGNLIWRVTINRLQERSPTYLGKRGGGTTSFINKLTLGKL